MDTGSPLTAILRQILENSLWASALGLMLALAWRWLPGWSRYALGLMVVCRLLMPALPSSSLSAANWWRPAPAESPVPASEFRKLPPLAAMPVDPWGNADSFPSRRTPAESEAESAVPSPWWSLERAAALWLAGAVLYGGWLALRQQAFNRWWKARKTPAGPGWEESMAACLTARDGRFLKRVRLWRVAGLRSPLACGILHPCILVPAHLDNALSGEERAHILRHELAHHRHRDLGWNLLFAAASALHWFNPLVHAGLPWILREREIQRDAEAVRSLPVHHAAGYGGTLLKLAALLPRARRSDMRTAPLTTSLLGIHHLKQRLTMIPKHHQHTIKPAARIIFTAAAGLLALLSFTGAAEENKAPAAPQPAPAPAPAEAKTPEPGSEAVSTEDEGRRLVSKLRGITIPRLQFANASVEEVVAYLRRKSMEHDVNESDPAKKGVNFILKGSPSTPVTLDLKNITLHDVIRSVCDVAGCRYRLEPNAVVIMAVSADEEKVLLTRVYRMSPEIARSWGWSAEKPDQFKAAAAAHLQMEWPEGGALTFSPGTTRVVIRTTMSQHDTVEAALDQSWREQLAPAKYTFRLTAKGIEGDHGGKPPLLSAAEFTSALQAILKRDPNTVVSILAEGDLSMAQLTTVLDQIRTAGLKNVNCTIRAGSQ